MVINNVKLMACCHYDGVSCT